MLVKSERRRGGGRESGDGRGRRREKETDRQTDRSPTDRQKNTMCPPSFPVPLAGRVTVTSRNSSGALEENASFSRDYSAKYLGRKINI